MLLPFTPPEKMRQRSVSSVATAIVALAIFLASVATAIAAATFHDRNLMFAAMAPLLLSFSFMALSAVATYGYVVMERPYLDGKGRPLGAGSYSFSTSDVFSRFIMREFIR